MHTLPHPRRSTGGLSSQQDSLSLPRFVFVAGNGFPEVIYASQRKILSSTGLKLLSIGPGDQVASAKILMDELASRLKLGSHLLLHMHGKIGPDDQHQLMFAESAESHVNTADFLDRLVRQAVKVREGKDQCPRRLPVLHVMSCHAGALSEEILPGSPLWKSAYILLYGGSKPILSCHYYAAQQTAAAYIHHCARLDEPVDPRRLFYLAGTRRGDSMRLLGGDLRAPLVLNAPKLPRDLMPVGLGRRLKGSVDDITDFFLSAIDITAEERQCSAPLSQANSELLHTRIYRRDVDAVESIIDKKPARRNGYPSADVVPVVSAIQWCTEPFGPAKKIVELLVSKGADLRETDALGNGPVLACLTRKDASLLHQLLARGADPNEKNTDGFTPLLVAIQKEFHEGIELLLEFGANINYSRGSQTAMKLAVASGDITLVRLLLDKGAGPEAGLSTALVDEAIRAGNPAIAYLLEAALAACQQD